MKKMLLTAIIACLAFAGYSAETALNSQTQENTVLMSAQITLVDMGDGYWWLCANPALTSDVYVTVDGPTTAGYTILMPAGSTCMKTMFSSSTELYIAEIF